MKDKNNTSRVMLSEKEKESNDKAWYKEYIDKLGAYSHSTGGLFYSVNDLGFTDYHRMKVNYDLFNNILDKKDFMYVIKPFGDSKDLGEMPAEFTNKDIISSKIKSLISLERDRPFQWNVMAVNTDACTRKAEMKTEYLTNMVQEMIMKPINDALEAEVQQQMELLQQQVQQQSQDPNVQQNPEAQHQLSEQVQSQQQQILDQAQEKLKALKPEEIDDYLQRKHRDPAEVLCDQLLQYVIKEQEVDEKFNQGFKDGLISGRTIFWTGIVADKPTLMVVNPLGFNFDRVNNLGRIEDGEWATYERYLNPTQVISEFYEYLEEEDIDKIYGNYINTTQQYFYSNNNTTGGVRVLHCEWKGLKQVKFVSGIDPETGEEFYTMVDPKYKLNKNIGDQNVETYWIPTRYEGYKIGTDIYVCMREVPGQHRDINNLYECKLSYIGNSYDSTNSVTTSLVDRMKHFQYLYNIIWYRIELLTAKDDVKKLLIGSNAISASSELDVQKFLYYLKTMNIGIINMNEEGNKGMPFNINSYISQVDMSMSNDISRYIQLAQYIDSMCAQSIGINDNTFKEAEQVKLQTGKPFDSSILDSYFNTHKDIKRRVLERLIETMKVAYSTFQPDSISYFLDDVSVAQLNPDYELFDNNTYGIFIVDNPRIDDRIKQIEVLAQASLQAQKIDLSDVLDIMDTTNLEEAKDKLRVSEQKKRDELQEAQQQQMQAQQQAIQIQQQMQKEQNEFKMQYLIKQEELKKDRELQKQLILSMGFNEDKDLDKDGIPDIVEVYKTGKNIDIKEKALDIKNKALELKKQELEQKKKEHADNLSLKKKIMRQ